MVKLTDSKIVTHAKLSGEKKWHSQPSEPTLRSPLKTGTLIVWTCIGPLMVNLAYHTIVNFLTYTKTPKCTLQVYPWHICGYHFEN